MHTVFTTLMILTFIFICKLNSFGHPKLWYPKNANRSYLTCDNYKCSTYPEPDHPEQVVDKKQSCCLCLAKPIWISPEDKTTPLRLEYVRRNGQSFVKAGDPNSLFPTLIHNNGFLSELPSNICSFSKIVTLSLSHNEITTIGNISCLSSLDMLDLSYNKIHHIGNDTFTGNGNLRILRLHYNGLKTLDPATLTGKSLQIFIVDLSHNDLENIELSNLISETDFCKFDFANNKITEIINTNNFKLDPNKNYHGGMVHFNGNLFTKFIDFEKLGIYDIALLGTVFEYGFDMTDIKWDCDCRMEHYLEYAEDVIKKIWRDYFNITCWNPEEYRGVSLPQIVKEGKLNILICNLTDNCPKNCHCYDQPKEKRNVVNCNNANLTTLPEELPESNNLTLILSNNQITIFENRSYLANTSFLDLSGNLITTISNDAAGALKPDVKLNLANNSIQSLPQELQRIDPCSIFGYVKLKCDCNSLWIQQMVKNARSKGCADLSTFVCQTKKGNIPIEKIDKNEVCARETSYQEIYMAIVFGLCASLLFGSALSAYTFRFELYLIQRKYFYRFRKKMSKIMPVMKYDVFLSFDDGNDQLRAWVMNVLVFNLEASGYRVFVPCRNLKPATVREEELINCILKCQNSMVVLCNSYQRGGTIWIQKEWKYIWHKFLDIIDRNVIVVNYDQVESYDDMDARLRAFVRLGYDIDFSNRNHDLVAKIKQSLGRPIMASWSHKNANTRFVPKKIYEKITIDDKQNNFDLISESDKTFETICKSDNNCDSSNELDNTFDTISESENNSVYNISSGNIIEVKIYDIE